MWFPLSDSIGEWIRFSVSMVLLPTFCLERSWGKKPLHSTRNIFESIRFIIYLRRVWCVYVIFELLLITRIAQNIDHCLPKLNCLRILITWQLYNNIHKIGNVRSLACHWNATVNTIGKKNRVQSSLWTHNPPPPFGIRIIYRLAWYSVCL